MTVNEVMERLGVAAQRGVLLPREPAVPAEQGPSPRRGRRDGRSHRWGLFAADLAAALVTLGVLAFAPWQPRPGWEIVCLAPALVALHKLGGLYGRDELVLRKTTLDEAPSLVQTTGLFALAVSVGVPAIARPTLPPAGTLWLWGATALLVLAGRAVARVLSRHWTDLDRCLLIGTPSHLAVLRRRLARHEIDVSVVVELPLRHGGHREAATVDSETFFALLRSHRVDRVIIAPDGADAPDMLDLIRSAKAAGVRVSIVPRLLEVVGSSVEFDEVEGMMMLGVRGFGLSPSSRLLKRAFDLVASTLLLLILAPLLVALAIAIKLDSSGPALFRQTRIGRGDRPFEILKFRSMEVDAEARKQALRPFNEGKGLFKLAADPRTTRVGRFMRSTSLDEVPQLVNVLRGDMSLVGPRPLVVDEDALVHGLDRSRLHLTPGMTGPWQILGALRVPLDEMLTIDYLYVANWTLWTDVKILLRTLHYVLRRSGL